MVEMTEAEIERQQIECVFGLGGGELHVASEKFPDEWDGVFQHWYEGAPDYTADEFPDYVPCPDCGGGSQFCAGECGGYGKVCRSIRTAIVCEVYGEAATPDGWERIGSFSSSGEAECWEHNEGVDAECPLCDGSGYVYIGEGYREVVYRSLLP